MAYTQDGRLIAIDTPLGADVLLRAEVVPWLWFLSRTADCRIFQNMTVPDIVEKVCKDLGFTDVKRKLQASYEPREYCVQYRETDFNFVSRLLEEEGIAYFFEHDANQHILVLGDGPTAHAPSPYQAKIRCEFTGSHYGEEDLITAWEAEHELQPGKLALSDFNFETPVYGVCLRFHGAVGVSGNV